MTGISVILVISFVNMFSCTSYTSYKLPNERNRMAMIEQGKNDPMVEKNRKWVSVERDKERRKIM